MITVERIVIVMTVRMMLMGGAIVAGWIGYVSTLITLRLAGEIVQRDALHGALITLWAILTLAWIVAASGAWLRRQVQDAIRNRSDGLQYRAGWGTRPPAGADPGEAYMHDAADLFELGREAERRGRPAGS